MAEDLTLLKQWRDTGDPKYFQELYAQFKPTIEKAYQGSAYRSNVPQSAHKVWAAQSFYDALRTFNPTAGASLNTHIYGSVQNKQKRLNYTYQNVGHIPEPRASKIGLYQTELENMRATLGREPSSAELADHLGWGLREVGHIQKEVQKDLALTGGVEEQLTFESSVEEELLDDLYHDLTGEEQVAYDYFLGQHGKPRLVKANKKTIDFDAISARTGFSVSKLRALLGKIRAKLKAAQLGQR